MALLFRGGKEREARHHFIERGYLEVIIGLPSNLFYGTGIHACLLVMNKAGADRCDHVFIINADREFREGKAQNHLRPEDIDKIVHAYRNMADIPAYARKVPYAEIAAEDYNCSIRRYGARCFRRVVDILKCVRLTRRAALFFEVLPL
jgi:type I restriction enzyme M protein